MMILMVAAEFSPYIEAGPTAFIVAELSRALVQLGHEVSVVVPKYPGFEERGLLVARRLSPLDLPGGETATIFDGQLGSGVKLVLVDAPQYFERPQVYGEAGTDYPDSAERFGFFAQAVAAFVRQRQQQGSSFDVVHAYEWPGALAMLQLKAAPGAPPCLLLTGGLERAGNFPASAAPKLQLPPQFNTPFSAQMGGELCLLKAGVMQADAVTVPAPSVLVDFADESRHGALAVAFAERASVTTGILPGLDYAVYNPATDPELASRFDGQHLAAKGTCRSALMRQLGLEIEQARPLFLVILEPGVQHDVRELCVDLLRNEINLVVVGSDLDDTSSLPESVQRNCAVVSWRDSAFERKLYAAADFAVFTDNYPIDGLSIRKAQRYAAVPIARAAGAALDAIVDCDAQLETGTGFLFESMAQLAATVQRAISAYRSDGWPRLPRRVALLDLSWDRVAQRFQKLYRQLQKQ